RGAGAVVVVFRVRDAGAGAHALHFAGHDRGAVAHRVAVRQRALEHVADDLHVAVAVRAETLARRHPVLVDHAQRAPVDVLGVLVTGEGKAVPRVQPAMVGVAAFGGGAGDDHRG